MDEDEMFRQAFATLLRADRDTPPSPTKLNEALGRRKSNNLNGRMSKLRISLLLEAGFRKDESGRWSRRG